MTNPARSLRIIVVQGHRNTSGGNPEESKRTPAIANAITAALNAAGHEAVCLQNSDGRADDWFAGGLDAVARRVVSLHRTKPFDLMLDIHIEGNAAHTPGVFAIVPDGDGLQTLTPYAGSDSAISNHRDRMFATAIAQGVSRATGLKLRTSNVIAPGVMSEKQTGVGADLGWRLAMFAYTAPVRDRLVRLVLECGNIVADRATIDRAGFPEQVGRGVVLGIAATLGLDTELPVPVMFPPFGTSRTLQATHPVKITVPLLYARKWAETSQPVQAELAAGSVVPVRGWVIGEAVAGNPVWWIVGECDQGWRMWSGGTDVAGEAVLALPVAS